MFSSSSSSCSVPPSPAAHTHCMLISACPQRFKQPQDFRLNSHQGVIYVLIPSNLSNPLYSSHPGPSHRGAEAAATHGAPELAERLLGSARGVEALGQQHNAVEEEEGGQTIDDILEILNAAKGGRKGKLRRNNKLSRGKGQTHAHTYMYARVM